MPAAKSEGDRASLSDPASQKIKISIVTPGKEKPAEGSAPEGRSLKRLAPFCRSDQELSSVLKRLKTLQEPAAPLEQNKTGLQPRFEQFSLFQRGAPIDFKTLVEATQPHQKNGPS